MQSLLLLADFILHIDTHLQNIIAAYGSLTYGILFLIIFAETGLVVVPFLPGDSLLFAAGAIAALGALDVRLLVVLFLGAAVSGDAVNYAVGHYIGPKAFAMKNGFLKQEHLERTRLFFERYGGKAIIIARFIPIIRTFAPFVAGVGGMSYGRFALFNVTGALLWVLPFTLGGYFFGNVPFVREHFSLFILAIIGLSILPVLSQWWKHRKTEKNSVQPPASSF